MINIACVVEGHGDVEAVPIVIRRIAESLYPAMAIHIPPPIRIPKDKLIKPGEIERATELAARKIGSQGGRVYSETLDQPAFAARFDLEMARRADSFDKFYRDIVQLLTELQRSSKTNFTDSNSGGGHDYHS